jgi:AmiR/NasT family two-component response regulator
VVTDDDFAEMDSADVVLNVNAVVNVFTSIDECVALIGQLTTALETRDVIGQAKGILMVREGLTADEAFDILARASQRMNIKLRDVAAQVVASMVRGATPRSQSN